MSERGETKVGERKVEEREREVEGEREGRERRSVGQRKVKERERGVERLRGRGSERGGEWCVLPVLW